MPEKPSPLTTLLILTVCYAVGFVGTVAINSAIGFWYIALIKPVWAPPNWLLVPVWIVLHGLFGASARSLWTSQQRTWPLFFLSLTMALNAVWAVSLFYAHRPLPAFIIAGVLWWETLFAIVFAWRARDLAGRLLLPCILWATYALAFTGVVWRLNR